MELGREQIINAVLSNDVAAVAKMLEEFYLTKDGTPPLLTSGNKKLAAAMLSFASAMDHQDKLSRELAEELIERTAMAVDIFSFLKVVEEAQEAKVSDFGFVPKTVRSALKKETYSEKLAHEIEEMNFVAFGALISYIPSGEINQTRVELNVPIISRIYREKLIPADLLFAYMGICLREPIDVYARRMLPDMLSGATLLGVVIDGPDAGKSK